MAFLERHIPVTLGRKCLMAQGGTLMTGDLEAIQSVRKHSFMITCLHVQHTYAHVCTHMHML